MRQIRRQLGDGDTAPPRALTIDELARLSQSNVFEIGAHTVSHARLAGLVPAEQKREILGSKLWLENNLGVTVAGFSYPFGTPDAYDAETLDIVRTAGFGYACTVMNAPATPRSSLFELPRLAVEPWPAEELLARVEALLAH
jgi:peptidoglycan/xylan/chitin deacetylase (PgdA/CDA1 family)